MSRVGYVVPHRVNSLGVVMRRLIVNPRYSDFGVGCLVMVTSFGP